MAVPDLEADDVLGIMATNGKVENPIVVSTDKDLRQIPGMHCVPGADPEILTVSHGEGLYRWATQWLTGDSTDNYGGIRGIGPKKAERILGPKDEFVSALFCNVAERILRAYFEAGCSYEYCLLMGNLSRILTDEVGWVDGKVVLLDDLSDATDDPELVEWMLDTGPEDPTDPTGAFDEEEVAA